LEQDLKSYVMKFNIDKDAPLHPFVIGVLIAVMALLLSLWSLNLLEDRLIWLTFYPIIMIAALFGGMVYSLVGIVFSSLVGFLGLYFFANKPFFSDSAELIGMLVFIFNCLIISIVAEAYRRSRKKNKQLISEYEAKETQLMDLNNHIPASFLFKTKINEKGIPQVTYISKGVNFFTDKSVYEIIKKQSIILDLIHEKDRSKFIAHRDMAAKQFLPIDIDVRIHVLTEEEKWAHIHSVPHYTDHGIEWNGIFTEITERKKVEIKHLEVEHLLNLTQEMALVGGWVFDIRKKEAIWTQETKRIHGVDFNLQVDLKKSLNFYHPADMRRIRNLIGNVIRNGKPFSETFRKINSDGKIFWVKTSCKPIFENGKIVKLIGVTQKLSDRKELE